MAKIKAKAVVHEGSFIDINTFLDNEGNPVELIDVDLPDGYEFPFGPAGDSSGDDNQSQTDGGNGQGSQSSGSNSDGQSGQGGEPPSSGGEETGDEGEQESSSSNSDSSQNDSGDSGQSNNQQNNNQSDNRPQRRRPPDGAVFYDTDSKKYYKWDDKASKFVETTDPNGGA